MLLTGALLGVLAVGGWWLATRDGDGPATGGTAGPADGDDPRALAEAFVALLQKAEDEGDAAVTPDTLRPLVCAADMTEIEQAFAEEGAQDGPGEQRYAYSVKSVDTTTDTGTVIFERLDREGGEVETQQATLVREDGGWQICGLTEEPASEPTPTG